MILFSVGAEAQYKEGYYDAMEGKRRETLKAAAKQCVQSHTMLEYYSLPNYWQYTDVYPDLVDNCKRWWDMYSDETYLIKPGQSGTQSFSANHMQREHSVPKSWWKKGGSVEYTPCYSDLWNLYPSDGTANQKKLNYPLGPTASTTFDNGVTKVGRAQTGYGGGSANVFEPGDEYKGDFARAYFYVATVYDDINWVYHYMFNQEAWPTLTPWAYNMLLEWSRRDPVSQKERDRNNEAEKCQGNRNPFVDFPELAEYIWGVRQNEVFRIADQEGNDPTPPITGDPVMTAPVNGEALDFGTTAVGTVVMRPLQIDASNLTESLSVIVAGADRDCFEPEVTSISASEINSHGGYLLTISYKPVRTGRHTAKLTLYDGGLQGSVAVTLIGEALEHPDFSVLTALEPTDVTSTGYSANWTAAPDIADFYVVTRMRTVNGNDETETFETGETSYEFTDRLPGVAESYYVQYSRLGLLSPVSNTVYVPADSGVDDIFQPSPVRILTIPGGFMVAVDSENAAYGGDCALRVLDMQGRTVMIPDAVSDGDCFYLPSGIYMITAPGLIPVKLLVE